MPIIVSDERRTLVGYMVERYDGPIESKGPGELLAVLLFRHSTAIMFGPPCDETFSGHPLFARGLLPYGAFEVAGSSWLRSLERMNRVHRSHVTESFMAGKRHVILTFHDSTFECICKGVELLGVVQGTRRDAIAGFI
jgi:hypothetical protein